MDFGNIKSLILGSIFLTSIQYNNANQYAILDEFKFQILPSFSAINLHCSALNLKKDEKIKTTFNGTEIVTDDLMKLQEGDYGCELEASKATFKLESGIENLKKLDIVDIVFTVKGAGSHPNITFQSVDLNLINLCYKDESELDLLYWEINGGIDNKGLILRDEASGSYICRINSETTLKFSFEHIDHVPRITDLWVRLTGMDPKIYLTVSCNTKEHPGLEKNELRMSIYGKAIGWGAQSWNWTNVGASENTTAVNYIFIFSQLPCIYKCVAQNKYGSSDVVFFMFASKYKRPLTLGESWHFHADLNKKSFTLDMITSKENAFVQKLEKNQRDIYGFNNIRAPDTTRFTTEIEDDNKFSQTFQENKYFKFEFMPNVTDEDKVARDFRHHHIG